MKYLATALALSAGQALAQDYATYIPFDCYSEDIQVYGNETPNKVSDYLTMTGLDAYAHQLYEVTVCWNNDTDLITGVTTSWAKWVGGSPTDITRLNIIGRLSGLYHWNDGRNVSDATDYLLQQFWFQDADQLQEQHYRYMGYSNEIGSSAWTSARQTYFSSADLDGNGTLNRAEAHEFLKKVRPHDGKIDNLDTRYEKVNRHFDTATSLAGTSEMSFNAYTDLENWMLTQYNAEKLATVGWVKGENDADEIPHTCTDYTLAENDRIIYSAIQTGPDGIYDIAFQSVNRPYWNANGVADRTNTHTDFKEWGADHGLAGLMGHVDANGDIQSLGWIVRDNACSQPFIDDLGSSYSWTSPRTTVATIPQRSEQHKQQLVDIKDEMEKIRAGEIVEHDHDESAEKGLIAVTVIVWVAVIILALVFIYQMCMAKKGGNAVTRE